MGKISDRFKSKTNERFQDDYIEASHIYLDECLEILNNQVLSKNIDRDLLISTLIDCLSNTWFNDIKMQKIIKVKGKKYDIENIIKVIAINILDVNNNKSPTMHTIFKGAYEELQNKLLIDKEQTELSTDVLEVVSNKTDIKPNKETFKT